MVNHLTVLKGFTMRTAVLTAAALASVLAALPAEARDRNRGLMIDVKPRSWLDAGSGVQVGYGRDYATNTAAFGGGPVNGMSTRFDGNLPDRGLSGRGWSFDFLGANAVR